MKKFLLFVSCVFSVAFLVSAQATEVAPVITHIPVPIAVKGQPVRISANVLDPNGDLGAVTLRYAETQTGRPVSVAMKKGVGGKYTATIATKKMPGAKAFVYFIEAVDKAGNSKKTMWYPVQIQEPPKDAKPKDKSLTEKTVETVKSHPVISTVGGVAVVGGTAAVLAGGGGGNSDGAVSAAKALAGNWLVNDGYHSWIMALTTSGGQVSGNVASAPSGPATITGTISGNNVTLNVTWTHYGSTDVYTGTLSPCGTAMTGTYSCEGYTVGPW
ncbi:MAG: hypothetical protein JXN60_08790, partial [Lentisphaerae bacterium]|nr:hypothetical protein [Lentisphaerota bacterium]